MVNNDNLKKRLKLIKEPNFLSEVGGLISNYSYWADAINKEEIPWEDSRVSPGYSDNKKLIYVEDYFTGMEVDSYVDFLKSIRGKTKKTLEEFFKDQNEDIFKLLYIHKFGDENQYSFLLDILNNVDEKTFKEYLKEDFYLDFILNFAYFLNYDFEQDGKSSETFTKDEVLSLVDSNEILPLLANSNFSDQDSMELLRALNNWESIYERLYPLLGELEAVIRGEFHKVENLYNKKLNQVLEEDFRYPKDLLSNLGFDDLNFRKEEKIYIELRLIQTNTITFRLSTLNIKNLKITIGFIVEEIINKNKYKYDEETFQRKLKTMADPTRFSIISLIKERAYYVQELSEELHLTPATLSYHINQLHMDGFLKVEVKGRRTYYSLRKKVFEEIGQDFYKFSEKIVEVNGND